MVHLRQHAHTNKPCGVFVHLVFETVQRRCQLCWADDGQRLFHQRCGEQGDVAFGLSEHVEMEVVFSQAPEHCNPFLRRLRCEQAEVFQHGHLSAEDVAERRSGRLTAHGRDK